MEGLRSIEDVPEPYQRIFTEYPCFNMVQSKVLDDMLKTDESVVVSAPTGSGKTVIFELAIVRLLTHYQNIDALEQNFKIIYISPIKALCQERLIDWHSKFSNFGLKCTAITGDSTELDFSSITSHHLIISTPEKWDSLSRKWRDHEKIVRHIKLFMIDEVHLLHEDNRGCTLEVVVCRMKTVEQEKKIIEHNNSHGIRFVAVSATIPNVEDIARWICKSHHLKFFKFSEEMRPVKLNKVVLGYSYNPKTMTPFKFDLSLNYKLKHLIMQYSEGKPTLIFCSTRRSVEMTALHLMQGIKFELNAQQTQKLCEISQSIADEKIKSSFRCGIAYHHAGLSTDTRHCLEDAFRSGNLPVLVTTSTLSMGVNLPAHLVIIKSTKYYDKGGFQDYTETAIQQMIGRAGRPQYDVTGTALILTTQLDKVKFEKMMNCNTEIESNLHRHLIEHLNAEVVLRTITDLDVAMQWIASTYLYVRAFKNPRHYGLPCGLTKEQIDKKLLEIFQIDLNKLVSSGMLCMDQNIIITPTITGQLMAKYYLAFETMKLFTQLSGTESLIQILALISKCREFSDVRLRTSDKKTLNLLNKCSSKSTIRFPLNGRIKTGEMKVNCIIQAVLGNLDIPDHSIQTESFNIMRNGARIARCLIEYLDTKGKNCYRALLNAIILGKCFNAKLWEDSPYVTKQLSGIGNVLSTQLANAGKTSFEKILQSNPRDLELILRKKPPAGDALYKEILHIPKYELKLEKLVQNEDICRLELTVNLLNLKDVEEHCTVNTNSVMCLIVGNNKNEILLHERYQHSYLIENPSFTKYINVVDFRDLEEVDAHFISEDWVGFDCHRVVTFQPKQASKEDTSPQKKNQTYMQMFLDMYMKIKKPKIHALKNKNEGNKNQEATKKDNKKNTIQKRDDEIQLYKEAKVKQIQEAKATPKKQTKTKNTVDSTSPSKTTRYVAKKSPNKTPDKNQGTINQWLKNVKEADNLPTSSDCPHVSIETCASQNDKYFIVNDEKQQNNEQCSSKNLVNIHSSPINKKEKVISSANVDNASRDDIPSSTQIPEEEKTDKENEDNEATNTSFASAEDSEISKTIKTKEDKRDEEFCMKQKMNSLSHPSLLSIQQKYTQPNNSLANSEKPCSSTKVSATRINRFATKRKLPKPSNIVTDGDQPKRKRLEEFKLPDKKKISHQDNSAAMNSNIYTITEILEPKMDANQNKYTFSDKNKDHNNNNPQKNISWRSPLVFSPATKFSPKIAYQKTSSSREDFRFERNSEAPNNSGKQKNVPNLMVNIIKTPKKQSKQMPDYSPFPLRDKDYEEEEKPEKEVDEDDMDYSDIYSSPTLDRIKSSKKYKQCSPKSAMEYFSQFQQRTGTSEQQAEVSKADSTQKQNHDESVKENLERSKDSFQTFEFEERLSSPEFQNDAACQNRSFAHNQTIQNSQDYMDPMAVYPDNPTKYHQGAQKFYQPAQNTITSQISGPCSGCQNPQCSENIYRRPEYQVSQRMNVIESPPSHVTNARMPFIPRPILPPFYNYRKEFDPRLQMSSNPNHSVYYPDANQSQYFTREVPSQYQAVRHMYPEQFPNEVVHDKTFAYAPSWSESSGAKKEQASSMRGYLDYAYPRSMNTPELGGNHNDHKPRSFCEEQTPYREDTLNNSISLPTKSKHIPTQINNNFVEERSFYQPEPEIYNPRFSSQPMDHQILKTPQRNPRSNMELGFPKVESQYFEDRQNAMHRFVQNGNQVPPLPVVVPNYRQFYNQNIGPPRYIPEAYTRGMMEQPVVTEYMQPYMSPKRYGQHLPPQSYNDKEYLMNKFFHSLDY